MRVKGPNGLVLTLPDGVAEGLLRDPNGEYEQVEDEKSEKSKSTTKKSSSKK